jgi:hypothetical protein
MQVSTDDRLKSFPPGTTTGLPTIAIDFDGVIHDDYLGFHDGTIYGPPIEGSLDAIKFLSSRFKVVIFTAKAKPDRPLVGGKTGQELLWDWFNKHKISQCITEITSEKPRALIYIDDNAYHFTNWSKATSDLIEYFKP